MGDGFIFQILFFRSTHTNTKNTKTKRKGFVEMGKPQRSKRTHKNIKDFKKKCRTRKKTKDIDQIHDDMKPNKIDSYLHQIIDPDLPGEGQFYCVTCARYFINDKCFADHKKTKNHKKRLRLLKEVPYSHAEAEAAAGMGTYHIKIENKKKEKKGEEMDVGLPTLVSNTDQILEQLSLAMK